MILTSEHRSIKRHLLSFWQVSLFSLAAVSGAQAQNGVPEADPAINTANNTSSNTVSHAVGNMTSNQERYLAYADSADMAIASSRWDRGEEMIRAALRTDPANPGNPMLFANLGVCLSNQKRYGDALEAFEIGLVKAPRSTAILSSRALTYLAMGRDTDALDDLNIALETDTTLRQARRLRGNLLLARRDTAGAASDFRILMRQHPDEPDAPAGLARILESGGRTQEARELYRQALTLEKDPEIQPILHTGIIRTLIEEEALNEADEAVREALAAFPRFGYIYLMRAWLHRLRFQYEEERLDKKMAAEYGVEIQIIESLLPTHD